MKQKWHQILWNFDSLRHQLVKGYHIDIFLNVPSGWKYGRSKNLPNGLIIPESLKVKRTSDDDGWDDNSTSDLPSYLSKRPKKTANDDNIDKTGKIKQCIVDVLDMIFDIILV